VAIRSTNTAERSVLAVDGGVGDVTDEEAGAHGRGEQYGGSEDRPGLTWGTASGSLRTSGGRALLAATGREVCPFDPRPISGGLGPDEVG
jgi:hypothetical protein